MQVQKLGGWVFYIGDHADQLDREKCGKWMHFFNDKSFAASVCREAVLSGIVAEAKHTDESTGVCCFYGYHNRNTDFRSYFIRFDDGARLELMTKPGLDDQEKPLNRTGYAHIAFSVGSKERVNSMTEVLKDAGFEVVSGPRTTGDGYYESCIVVIEGNQIEITE